MGLINSLGLKAKIRPQKYKKARYVIKHFRKKDLLMIIMKFDKFDKLPFANMSQLKVTFT